MKRGEIDAISNLDPVIAQLESDGSIVPVIDTRTAKGMQEVYGGAYAAGCIYVPSDFVEEVPQHGAGGRQRDRARAALHPDLHSGPDRRGGAARLLHRQGALQGGAREEPRRVQARRLDRHGRRAGGLPRSQVVRPADPGGAERRPREDHRHVVPAEGGAEVQADGRAGRALVRPRGDHLRIRRPRRRRPLHGRARRVAAHRARASSCRSSAPPAAASRRC